MIEGEQINSRQGVAWYRGKHIRVEHRRQHQIIGSQGVAWYPSLEEEQISSRQGVVWYRKKNGMAGRADQWREWNDLLQYRELHVMAGKEDPLNAAESYMVKGAVGNALGGRIL